ASAVTTWPFVMSRAMRFSLIGRRLLRDIVGLYARHLSRSSLLCGPAHAGPIDRHYRARLPAVARGRVEVALLQPRHGAGPRGGAQVGGARPRRVVDQPVGVRADVHAGVVTDRAGDELVA